jgi:hypothetical protein
MVEGVDQRGGCEQQVQEHGALERYGRQVAAFGPDIQPMLLSSAIVVVGVGVLAACSRRR